MASTAELRARVMEFDESEAITDSRLLKRAALVLALVIVAFVMARSLGLESGTIGMAGAALLLMLDNLGKSAEHQSENVVKVYNEIEWITIFFFVGLFIVIAGVEHAGLLRLLADKLLAATGGDFKVTGYSVLWSSAVLSAIVDNIPFVATMIPADQVDGACIRRRGRADAALVVPFAGAPVSGGNGTLIGASANLTVAGIAERNGIPFRFMTYTRIAFPLMLIHVAICNVYVWWRYF
jgi:Na+/H+ antiporter NhaD/arsenite permease-like protein